MGFGDKLKNMIAPPVDGEEEEYVELSADEAKAISEIGRASCRERV